MKKYNEKTVDVGGATGMSGADKAKLSNIARDVEQIKATNITYAELKALRDAGNLTPGRQYRITDYHCTTTAEDTMSADHQFDIIVVADTNSVLNENARACLHEGDTYFSSNGCKLESWQLKYCIDNDDTRFSWADTANGKGVIFFMKDERENECFYDFKNMLFKRWKITECEKSSSLVGFYSCKDIEEMSVDEEDFVWCYTFNKWDEDNNCYVEGDNSFNSSVYNNKLGYKSINIVFLGDSCYSNTFGFICYSNTFGTNCYSNTFGNSCFSNTFGFICHSNTFGTDCYSNTFGTNCNSNTFGNSCFSNTFGTDCNSNTFGTDCNSNTFGFICYSNTFGDSCYSNTFGDSCNSNTFGTDCNSNTFGDRCYSNTFGDSCNSNTFGTSSSVKNYVRNIILENGVSNTYINCTATTSRYSYFQNVHVNSGVNGKTLTVETAGNEFLTTFGSSNDTKINV